LLFIPSEFLLASEDFPEEFLESPVYPISNPLYGAFSPVFWSPSDRQKTFYNFWEKTFSARIQFPDSVQIPFALPIPSEALLDPEDFLNNIQGSPAL